MNELWLVRHGQTEWSAAGRHTSTTDLPLLAEGEEAARGLRPRLDGLRFAQVLTSPRLRARRTAALAGFADADLDEDLVEWDYGAYEGATTAEIHQRVPGWSVWSHPTPGGEAAAQVGVRLDRVIARARVVEGRTLVFGHGHSLRALTARWLGLPVAAGRMWQLDPATVSALAYEHDSPVVRMWNAP